MRVLRVLFLKIQGWVGLDKAFMYHHISNRVVCCSSQGLNRKDTPVENKGSSSPRTKRNYRCFFSCT